MRHTWFVNHYDSQYRYTCKSDEPGRKLTWAVWSWPNTPAGSYRVEVFIPPQEATAIVEYEIGRDSAGLVIDPVRLNQAHHRGSWATVANVDFPGGRLWLLLGDYPSEASGQNDWCAWGGHHSIGAANARIVTTISTTPTTTTPGTEAPSEPLNVEAMVPGVPRHLDVRTDDRGLRVTWAPPESDGGSPITGYRVSWSGGPNSREEITPPASVIFNIAGLANDTAYTVEVAAMNLHGQGIPASEIETTRRTTLPATGRVEVGFPNHRWDSYSRNYWTSEGSTCRFLRGCGNNFATTSQAGRSVWWNMGHMQGVFTFGRYLAEHVHPEQWPTTGRVLWRIYEKRTGDTRFRLVRTFRPPSQEGRSRWWSYSRSPIELDGEVRIRATGRDSGQRIAVQSVRLNHVDVLPEHKLTAQLMCIKGQIDQQEIATVFTTAVEEILNYAWTYLEDMIESQLNPEQNLLAELDKILVDILDDGKASPEIIRKARRARGLLKSAGTIGAVAEAVLAVIEILREYSKELPIALERLSTIAHHQMIRENQCALFHAPVFWQGYSKFSDDIAYLASNGSKFSTGGAICWPEFRKHGEVPKEACDLSFVE